MLDLMAGIEDLSRELSQKLQQRRDSLRPRPHRGSTLRPGKDTPLWNALIAIVRARLKQRGDRAILARELGLHRARIGEFFDTTSAMPDAERTLRLLLWLGQNPAEPEET